MHRTYAQQCSAYLAGMARGKHRDKKDSMEKEAISSDAEMVGPAAVWRRTTAEDGSRWR